MISHRVWQSRLQSDPARVGHTLRAYVSDRPEEPEAFTIIVVLPAVAHADVGRSLAETLRQRVEENVFAFQADTIKVTISVGASYG